MHVLTVLYQLKGKGAGGHIHAFEKPWFTTFLSLVACWMSLLLHELAKKIQSCCLQFGEHAKAEVKQPLLQVQLLPGCVSCTC